MKILKHFIVVLLGLISLYAAHGQSKLMYKNRCLLLRDEGLSQLSYVSLAEPKTNWYVLVPKGRDIQLIGKGRLLIGTVSGYEEREIKTGNKVFEFTMFDGTVAARRLRNGNTLLVGVNWQGKEGIVLVEVDSKGDIQRTIVYPGFTYVRLVRETTQGTFLVSANTKIFEGNEKGEIIWQATLVGPEKINAWQAVRLSNGSVVVSCGYAANIQVISADGKPVSTITGPAEVNPHFYAGMQVLANGNFVVTNWQSHGPGNGGSGIQLLEYSPGGKLVWSWKQDPEKYSSLQGVVVLDGLDLNLMHSENENGVLAPVK